MSKTITNNTIDTTKYPFEVRIEGEEKDVEYLVRFLDVPNIIGVGNTIDEAISEARENLGVFLEYLVDNKRDIPNPSIEKSFIDLSGKMTLRVSKTTHWKIQQKAAQEGISVNSFLNEAIINYLNYLGFNQASSNKKTKKEDKRNTIARINKLILK